MAWTTSKGWRLSTGSGRTFLTSSDGSLHGADWVQNVLPAGSAVIVNEGETYHVGDPELVSADVAMPEIPAKYQWSLRLYNVDQFLRVRTVAR